MADGLADDTGDQRAGVGNQRPARLDGVFDVSSK